MRHSRKHSTDLKGLYAESFCALVVIRFILIVLLLVFLAPKQEEKQSDNRDRGAIRAEIIWPTGYDMDIDLWVMAPTEPRPVGWTNKSGRVFDLIRDDLGNLFDPDALNYEISYGRSAPAGEYIFNVYWYANRTEYTRVEVRVIITMIKDDSQGKGRQVQIWSGVVVLERVGHEVTAIRFTLDDQRNLVPNSFSTIFKPLFTRPI